MKRKKAASWDQSRFEGLGFSMELPNALNTASGGYQARERPGEEREEKAVSKQAPLGWAGRPSCTLPPACPRGPAVIRLSRSNRTQQHGWARQLRHTDLADVGAVGQCTDGQESNGRRQWQRRGLSWSLSGDALQMVSRRAARRRSGRWASRRGGSGVMADVVADGAPWLSLTLPTHHTPQDSA